ncbi:MAG: hypothetical protein BAA04_00220 [Firmicutes bacterium ZCTH02-B6]|nr:MAG: hypothetical protein BAA04_00220 [Firmicutes bacterium ZCTH02-B6]
MRRFDRVAIFAAAIGLGAAVLATWLSRWTTGLLAGAAGFALSYGAGLWLLAPMTQYVAFIQRLAGGDFDEEAPATGDRRFAPLAQGLEAMRLHLRAWMGQIARSAIEFEGSLQVLDLVHVMHFLRSGKRSGTLVLQRGGEMALQFWKGGEVVGALCGAASGQDAFWVPFGWERGSFKFSPRLDPTVNLSARWEMLLLSAVRRVDNPRKWGRLVPKPSTVVRRTALADHMPLRQLLTAEEWTIWSALSGEMSAADIATLLGETVHKTWHALYCFSALGLVEPVDDSVLRGFAPAVAPLERAGRVGPGETVPSRIVPGDEKPDGAAAARQPPAEEVRMPAAVPGQLRSTSPARSASPHLPAADGRNVISLDQARRRRR